uniref:Uncharacterized protein n=1 Tax=Anopheles farauti TaxID=69004 RepID=A0A182QFL7_9DIPT
MLLRFSRFWAYMRPTVMAAGRAGGTAIVIRSSDSTMILTAPISRLIFVYSWRLRDRYALAGQHRLVQDAVAGQQHRIALHGAAGGRYLQHVARHQEPRLDRFRLHRVAQHHRRVGALDRRVEGTLVALRLDDRHRDAERAHQDDHHRVVVVLVEEPQHHREDLKHVERIEHLQEEQRQHAAQGDENLVAAVNQPPDALLVHGQALRVVDQHARHLHVQALQLDEPLALVAPDVAQLLAAEVTHRAGVLEPATRPVIGHLERVERPKEPDIVGDAVLRSVGGQQQPVAPPVHHQPQYAEREQEADVAQERFAQAPLVPGDEHLIVLAVVQDVVHGRLQAGLLQQPG